MAETDGLVGGTSGERHRDAPVDSDLEHSGGRLEVTGVPSEQRAAVLRVVGELDVLTAPILTAHIHRHFEQRSVQDERRLVLDFSGVTFLASAGLAVLANAINLATQYDTEVRLIATARVVLRPLSLTGLDQALRIEPDLACAVAGD